MGNNFVVLTVTDQSGNITSCVSVVTVMEGEFPCCNVTANAGADQTICPGGEGTTLSASGGTFYHWSPGDGISDTLIANPTANPSVTTTYIVTVSNETGGGTELVVNGDFESGNTGFTTDYTLSLIHI